MQRRFVRKLFIIAFLTVVSIPHIMKSLSTIDINNPAKSFQHSKAPVLSPARQTHIVYGDKTGGGHMHGMHKPCKSEFPDGWDANKITAVIEKTAANDNLDWHQQGNGYYVADGTENGIVIRVVVDRSDNEIITAYPINTPRNPCPRAANDD